MIIVTKKWGITVTHSLKYVALALWSVESVEEIIIRIWKITIYVLQWHAFVTLVKKVGEQNDKKCWYWLHL